MTREHMGTVVGLVVTRLRHIADRLAGAGDYVNAAAVRREADRLEAATDWMPRPGPSPEQQAR